MADPEATRNENGRLRYTERPKTPITHQTWVSAIAHNILVLSDEVYENFYYLPKSPRPAALAALTELADRTLTVGSAGISFAATGWRIGWIHGPSELIKYVTSAHTRICFSSPAALQKTVSEALTLAYENGYFEATRKDYIKEYETFSFVFDGLSLPYTVEQGGYFLLVNFEKLKILDDYKYPADSEARGTNDYKLVYCREYLVDCRRSLFANSPNCI